MREENNNKKKIKIKSFNYKWYQFLIIYGIINIFFFYCWFSPGINGIFPELFADNLHEDMEGLSGVLELIMLPWQVGLLIISTVISIAILLILEVVSILIFKLGYFRSEVKDGEKILLSHYIKNAVLCFLLAYLLCIILFGLIRHILFYVFIYLPVPFFTFILIYLKIKNNKEESAIRKTNWSTPLIYLSIIIGIYFCVNFLLILYSLFSI